MKRLPLLLATTVSAWGAASLTVTSRAIDSTGSIVTLGIGGVSGSLSPATGITGITVSLVGSSNSNPLKQVSATSSGSTVTVTLSTPAFSGETISVALSTNPTSNLTDTGGNTPAASQTGTATNSSTVNGVTFTTSSANLYLLGQWNDATAGGHNYKAPIGEGGHLTTVVTASDCYIQSNGNTVTLKVSVDGGAPSSISPAAGWSWSVLFRGLSDAAHMLDVYSINTVGTHLDRDATLRCSGASPTLATPTGYSTFLPINTAPFSTYSRLDGSPAIGTTHGYTNQATYAWAGSGVRFRAAITDLWLMGYDGNTPGAIALLQDGAQIASITPGGVLGYWPVWHLATGLDNAAHQYEILGIGVAQQNWGPYGLMLTGAGGLISETPALKATLSYYGDSIPGESSGSITSGLVTTSRITSQAVGMGSQHRGNTGQRVSTFLRDNTSQITAASPKPRVLVVQGGTNDVAGAVTIGDAVTPGTFTGDYKTMLVNLGAGLTAPTVMVCRGIMPKTGSAPAVIAPYNTAIQVAIAAYMATNPAVPAYYNSADAWLIPATDLGDGTHPNDIGSAKVAAHEIPAVQAAYFVRSFSWM